jgi:hypothetical protein
MLGKAKLGKTVVRWSARLGQARSVLFIWLNQTNQRDQMDQTDRTDQMNETGGGLFQHPVRSGVICQFRTLPPHVDCSLAQGRAWYTLESSARSQPP